MYSWNIILYAGFVAAFLYANLSDGGGFSSQKEKSWTYEFRSVESKTSNADLLSYLCHVEKISRGIYSMSGILNFNLDIEENDNMEVEIVVYRSKDGSENNYRLTPLTVPRQHFYKFMNSFYKDMAMESLSKCSDLPVFEDEFKPPVEKRNYTLDKCQFSQDNLPEHLQDGFYKLILSGYGPVEFTITIVSQVERAF